MFTKTQIFLFFIAKQLFCIFRTFGDVWKSKQGGGGKIVDETSRRNIMPVFL
jgi:hypothetical protein